MSMNVIGMPAFVDYYTIHDPETGIVGFVPHSTSSKSDVQRGYPSDTQFLTVAEVSQGSNSTALFTSWAICLVLMYLIFDFWNAFLRPKWQKDWS